MRVEEVGFAKDSLLERDGFERLVPRHEGQGFPKHRAGCARWRMKFACLSIPREEEPTRRDGFVPPAPISLSRETEGSKTVSSSGPASAAVFVGPRPCRELKSILLFERRHAEYLR
jgi:hypothetical protein